MLPRIVVGLALALLVMASAAQSQEVASSFKELTLVVKPGERLAVTNVNGKTVSGRLKALSEDDLVLTIRDRPVLIPTGEIRKVSRLGDPVSDGLAGGLGIGALAGFLIMALAGEEATEPEESTAELYLVFMAIGAGVGAGAGAAADAALERKVEIFSTQARGVRVAPILARHRMGLAITWRF
jgi:hypothetical protein